MKHKQYIHENHKERKKPIHEDLPQTKPYRQKANISERHHATKLPVGEKNKL